MSCNKNRIRLQEVAQAAGVSVSTVSTVLNGKCDLIRISQVTRDRV